MRLISTAALSTLLLFTTVFSWANTSTFEDPFTAKENIANHRSCVSNLYVKVAADWVDLKSLPDSGAKTLAQLHNRQYLCEISVEKEWLFVMAVPFADGTNTLCAANAPHTPGKDCNEMANFPVKWKPGKEQSTKDCRLTSEPDEEGNMLVTYTTGNCAAGWLRKDQVFYFAD